MMDTIAELWHGNICPQTESRNNTSAMKELMEFMARHHESLLKSVTDGQKGITPKKLRLAGIVFFLASLFCL